MADVYASLSAADQLNVRSKLFAIIQTKACPTVDTSSITSADSLSDAGTRAIAVDCFQTASGAAGPDGPGVLDQSTYSRLVGWWPSLPMWEKGAVVAGGIGVLGLAWYGIKRAKRHHRLRA